ncbi:MAG: ferrous iron transport protein B [bacterium]
MLIQQKQPPIILVGNPNVGKSVIFGALTGKYSIVSNYPGTSVEINQGKLIGITQEVEVIDTPGVNSLLGQSEDELVTKRILIGTNPKTIVQVIDSKNLKRSLAITLQLLEFEAPLILVLNMIDEAKQQGVKINTEELSTSLPGVEIVETIATEGIGVSKLKKIIFSEPKKVKHIVTYNKQIEDNLVKVKDLLSVSHPFYNRALGLGILTEDKEILTLVEKTIKPEGLTLINHVVTTTQNKETHPLNLTIINRRMAAAKYLYSRVVSVSTFRRNSASEIIDKLSRSPFSGIIISFLLLYLMYLIVGKFGAGILVDLIEKKIFINFINPVVEKNVYRLIPFPILQRALVGEYGIISMGLTLAIGILLPIVSIFFLFFGFLEDSGYLPRLAILTDNAFKKVGLNGKAILPIILGFSCGTMAIFTTRILDTKKERFIAILLIALGIPCSAQLGIILGMSASVSLPGLFLIFFTVIIQLLLVGYTANRLIKGEKPDFIVELPPIRLPSLYNITIKTYSRIKWFLKEAIPLFIVGAFILFLGKEIGFSSSLEGAIGPILAKLLDLPFTTVNAFFMGFLRKDAGVVVLKNMAEKGELTSIQVVVSLVVITLFVPCIANLFAIVKEQGVKKAFLIIMFIIPYAFLVGAVLNKLLRVFPII